MMTRKEWKTLIVAIFIGSVCIGAVSAQGGLVSDYPELKPLVDFVGEEEISVMDLVGYKAAEKAMEELGFSKGDPNILALTDAGYVAKIDKYSTERALNGLMMAAGVSQGKGNLVNVHRAYNKPLWFAFFDKATGDCIYLEVNKSYLKSWLDRESAGSVNLSAFMEVGADALFSKISRENIDPDRLITEEGAKAWHHNFEEKTFGGNEFSIITISAVWSKGISNEFLRSAELHNHICPGLTSGYFIAEYLKKHYPLKKGEQWVVWAVPPWCKDDALQQIFDATVGKRRMAVMYIPGNISKKLPPEYKNIAGIYVKIGKTGEAKAIVLGWDWDKACSDCGITRKDFKDFSSYKWWWTRLRADVMLMEHEPEEYISVLMEKDLGNQGSVKAMNARWMAVGANPLVELGIMPPENTATPKTSEKTHSIPVTCVIAAIAIASVLAIVRKNMQK
ncbi:MAG: FmdE family protein [Candidatus Methanospirare jalkutatii]|nr:FmdE family protein [Candidatus Methanospirare jalkutatii]